VITNWQAGNTFKKDHIEQHQKKTDEKVSIWRQSSILLLHAAIIAGNVRVPPVAPAKAAYAKFY
jgi:hypothetical protein